MSERFVKIDRATAQRLGVKGDAVRASMVEPRYGCHNRPPLGAERLVQDGMAGLSEVTRLPVPRYTLIPHRMSTTCQHPSATDPKCEGCRWRQGCA